MNATPSEAIGSEFYIDISTQGDGCRYCTEPGASSKWWKCPSGWLNNIYSGTFSTVVQFGCDANTNLTFSEPKSLQGYYFSHWNLDGVGCYNDRVNITLESYQVLNSYHYLTVHYAEDSTEPVVEVVVPRDISPAEFYSDEILVQAAVTEIGSGLKNVTVQFLAQPGNWSTPTYPMTYNPNSLYYEYLFDMSQVNSSSINVYVEAEDRAHNIGADTNLFRIDNSAPVTIKNISESRSCNSTELQDYDNRRYQYEGCAILNETSKISLNATDTGAGVNETWYRIRYNGNWTGWLAYAKPFNFDEPGLHYLEYYSTDLLGNEESHHYEIDYLTKPPASPSPPSPPAPPSPPFGPAEDEDEPLKKSHSSRGAKEDEQEREDSWKEELPSKRVERGIPPAVTEVPEPILPTADEEPQNWLLLLVVILLLAIILILIKLIRRT